MTDEQVPWPWRGLDQYAEEAQNSEKVGIWLGRISEGLDLIDYMINLATASLNETAKATNVLAALACYTRAFRGLRAATILATSGLYLEARVYARDVYESASLARMLALRPDKADSWMLANRWIKDNEVRQYAENFTAPGMPIQDSAYRQYYQLASNLHHPTARACLPLVLTDASKPCAPQLTSDYNEDALSNSLAEIALECGFVCLTMINAAAGPEVIPPSWRQAVAEYVAAVGAGADWSHLERDWQAEADRFADLAAHVIPADQLAALLKEHPNSLDNVRARRDQD
ncbi:hypothetical protein [Amycolatopsis orientalis]|uniref:hypothetical protein n=1 Tax=Amycolatopsis orientalis TaxID=31958 RepID=UPI000422ADEC|nr:hypothetical protein [Amycolatopsis orientalis]